VSETQVPESAKTGASRRQVDDGNSITRVDGSGACLQQGSNTFKKWAYPTEIVDEHGIARQFEVEVFPLFRVYISR
jgi:hypothetical protein